MERRREKRKGSSAFCEMKTLLSATLKRRSLIYFFLFTINTPMCPSKKKIRQCGNEYHNILVTKSIILLYAHTHTKMCIIRSWPMSKTRSASMYKTKGKVLAPIWVLAPICSYSKIFCSQIDHTLPNLYHLCNKKTFFGYVKK